MAARRHERPTLAPAFDVQKFARESDERIRTAVRVESAPDPGEPPPESRPSGGSRRATARSSTPPSIDDDEIPKRSERRLTRGARISVELPQEATPSVRFPLLAREDPPPTQGVPILAPQEPDDSGLSMQSVPILAPQEPDDSGPSMQSVPILAIDDARLKRLPLDHRAGFVLALMDGATDLGTVVELSAMDRDETLAVVRFLTSAGIIRLS